jgi:hypothetical protein
LKLVEDDFKFDGPEIRVMKEFERFQKMVLSTKSVEKADGRDDSRDKGRGRKDHDERAIET